MSVELNTLAPKKWTGDFSGSTPTLDSSDGVRAGDMAIDTGSTPPLFWHCQYNAEGNPVWIPVVNLVNLTASTGIVTGGELSINADTTKFDVEAGLGYVINSESDPMSQVPVFVSWEAKTAQVTPYLLTHQRTEVMVDSSGELVLKTSLSADDYRDYIYVGKVVHNNQTTINAVSTLPNTMYNAELKTLDLAQALGSVNASGNVYGANGENLSLDKTSGVIFRIGSNYANDKKTPNLFESPAGTALSFRYRYRNASGGFTTSTPVTSVDPEHYDDGTGTLATVDNNKFTIQRIYLYAGSDLTYVTYGQSQYASLSDARAGIESEQPVIDPVTAAEACLRAFLIMKQGTVSLLNTSNVFFRSGGKLGEPQAGGAAGGDVVSTGTSSDNAIARFDGTSGKLIQNGTHSFIDDNGVLLLQTQSDSPSDIGIIDEVYGSGGAPGLIGKRARGTREAPTAVQAEDTLAYVAGRGYGANSFSAYGRGAVTIRAAEGWTDSAQGTYVAVMTTANGTVTPVERMRIAHDGTVTFDGQLTSRLQVSTVTAGTTTLGSSNCVVLCDASSGTVTLNLPTSVGVAGKVYHVKKTDSSENQVVVTPYGSQKVDGRSSVEIGDQHVCVTIVSDGSNWHII